MKDFIRPFCLSEGLFKGNIVRAGAVLDDIMQRRNYPEPIAELLAEAVVLTALLASSIKYSGLFTLQIKGDGIVNMLVVDINEDGKMRAVAKWDEEKLKTLTQQDIKEKGEISSLFSSGHVLFTVDNAFGRERYQGTVELVGENLADSMLHYFQMSAQIKTALKVAVKAPSSKEEGWGVAGIMLQQMPLFGGSKHLDKTEEERDEEWNTDVIMLASLSDKEMLDNKISAERLLFLIYNEQTITVFDEKPLKFSCRCGEKKILSVLKTLSPEELDDAFQDGKAEITCEFCNKTYTLTREDLERVEIKE